ncbi:Hypothetical predicted protein, partial [Pelobates cultripes]
HPHPHIHKQTYRHPQTDIHNLTGMQQTILRACVWSANLPVRKGRRMRQGWLVKACDTMLAWPLLWDM